MTLKRLLGALEVVNASGPLARRITRLTRDSRRVTRGAVFFAVPGRARDGHDFIPEAIARGAAAIVCERPGYIAPRAARVRVADAQEALARGAALFYRYPSRRLRVIGVSGGCARTTVAFMLEHLLETASVRTGLIGSVCHDTGDRVIPAQDAMPGPLETQQMLAAMVQAGCQACVLELNDAPGQRPVLGVEFDVRVGLDWPGEHLNSFERVPVPITATPRPATRSGSHPERWPRTVHLRVPWTPCRLDESIVELQVTPYGQDPIRLRAVCWRADPGGLDLWIEGAGPAFACRLPLIGRPNVSNALAAVGVGLALALPPTVIKRALETMAPVPGRLEPVAEGQPFGVYVDHARTEAALEEALRALQTVTPRQVLLAFGCGGGRDVGKRARLGQLAAEGADLTVITADNPRLEDPLQIAAQVQQGYLAVRGDGCLVELDRRRAIEALIRRAQPGDAVLIAGKGQATCQEVAGTIVPFDDRVHAREALSELGYAGGPPTRLRPSWRQEAA